MYAIYRLKYDAPESKHELELEDLALETSIDGSSIVLMGCGSSKSEIFISWF